MQIQELNNLANDLAVERLTIQQLEEDYQTELAKNEKLSQLQNQIEQAKLRKAEAQDKLLNAMKPEGLKSWKTDHANFSISKRVSASVDPIYKKEIEARLKDGKKVKGWTLNETEYLSIRTVK